MKMHKNRNIFLRAASLVLFAAMLVVLVVGTVQVSIGESEGDIKVTRQAIERAAVLCYATEGFYPPSLAYIEENYGVQINHERYFVSYEVFASNIMPNIYIHER